MKAYAATLVLLAACSNEPANDAQPSPEISHEDAELAAAGVLAEFYAAAAEADFDRWIALFTDDAYFYGTDATEIWPREEFAESVRESFASGTGWDFDVRDRKVTVSADGNTAWFAEISHFNGTNYTLRPTGVLVRDGDTWKIAQLVMGVPFPNDIHNPVRMGLQATMEGADAQLAAIDDVLNNLHLRASTGELDDYMSLYTEDAIFFGTDKTERWTMADLRAYAEPAFADGAGWTYTPTERHIELSPMMNVAWFDELLDQEKYGVARGTGALIRTDEGWKITQYHLTFPIPNEVVDDVIGAIKAAE